MAFTFRSLLIILIGILLSTGSMANEPVALLNGAMADHDQRTGRPFVKLTFAETSKEALRAFSENNAGEKIELCVAGRAIFTSVLIEPVYGGIWLISDPNWTDQTVIDLAKELNNAPKGEVEFRTVPRPK